MIKRIMFAAAMVFVAASAIAQTMHDKMVADPSNTVGVYRLYPSTFAKQTPVPKGYKPFYISHYGRHGSRYILRNYKFDNVLEILNEAKSKGQLTALGEDVLSRMERAAVVCAGRAGDLSPIGQQQQRAIAERMYRSYPDIFRNNPHITAEATTVPRVIMSMAAFGSELLRLDPKLDVEMDTGARFMPYLNAYSYDNIKELAKYIDKYRYPWGDWVERVNEFINENYDPTRLLNSLFKEEFAKRIAEAKMVFGTTFFESHSYGDAFVTNLYKVACNMPNTPCKEEFFSLFTAEERYQLWRAMNMIFYFEKGPSGVGGGFLDDVSWTLAQEFLDDATKKVEAGKPAVTLRFGHDGCVMGVLNTMKVKNWAERYDDLSQIENTWHDYDIPMACNMQFIFYRNAKTGDVILKLLLNEEELELPIKSDCAPYCHWSDFKAFYDKVLKESHDRLYSKYEK